MALVAVENSICVVAAKEEWAEERQDQQLEDVLGPVRELLKKVTECRG